MRVNTRTSEDLTEIEKAIIRNVQAVNLIRPDLHTSRECVRK